MTVAELERFVRARRAHGGCCDLALLGALSRPHAGADESHLINWGRHGLGIYDTMTETTWHRRERAPSARYRIFGPITRKEPVPMSENDMQLALRDGLLPELPLRLPTRATTWTGEVRVVHAAAYSRSRPRRSRRH